MGTQKTDADIIIAGGGLSGLAASIFAANAGYSVIQLAPKSGEDPRTSALMAPAVAPLVAAGLIKSPDEIGTPLTKIRIIDCTQRLIRAPEMLFDSSAAGLETFGWNFSNAALNRVFSDVAATLKNYAQHDDSLASFETDDAGVSVITGNGVALKARMLVGADGKASTVRRLAGIEVRQHTHKQSALVCDLQLQRGLDGTSVEFHYEAGPFTLVPAGGNMANLVWIDNADILADAKAMTPEDLASLFAAKAHNLFGTIEVLTPATVFPLSTLSIATAGQDRVALVGDAAHAFPPIGAQGLNLGLRDVAALGEALSNVDRSRDDWAQLAVASYAAERAGDLQRTTAFVEGLFQSLIMDFLPAQTVRAGGLWALKLNSTLRKRAMAFGMGAH